MKGCSSCEQQNPDDSRFCLRCGASLPDQAAPTDADSPPDDQKLWRGIIGPNKAIQFSIAEGWSWRPAADYYLKTFQQFSSSTGQRFTLTWHWPAFLFDPFLWFLYRKMYMYALIYAIGPVVSAFLTGDFTVGIVWRIIAGASANYLYYWHLKDHLMKISSRGGMDTLARMRLVEEEGGVQPYVLWLGVALHLLMVGVIIAAIEDSPPNGDFLPFPTDSKDQKFF